MNSLRWIATITYSGDNGLQFVKAHFEELEDLHDIVEKGPDWNAIERIEIVLNSIRRYPVTVEEAREL